MSVAAVQPSCTWFVVPVAVRPLGAVGACVSGAGALLTVIATDADVVARLAVSVATAVTLCGPSATVRLSQVNEYGALVSGAADVVPVDLELHRRDTAVVRRVRGQRHRGAR